MQIESVYLAKDPECPNQYRLWFCPPHPVGVSTLLGFEVIILANVLRRRQCQVPGIPDTFTSLSIAVMAALKDRRAELRASPAKADIISVWTLHTADRGPDAAIWVARALVEDNLGLKV
jgi:hypothetical protein